MPLNPVSIATALLNRRKTEKQPKPPGNPSAKVRLLAILPVLVTIVAFILSFLCVYAGHTPGMMEEYAIFTLNTSRIGENIRQDLDNKIMAFNFDFNSKRSLQPTATAAPTTLITLAPRGGIGGIFSSVTAKGGSEIDSAKSEIHSKVTSAESELHSKANSIKSAAEAEITGTVAEIEANLVKLVNKAFTEIIDGLELRDFYSVHVMTTCEGEYQLPNGNNITVGNGTLPLPGTHKVVDSCSAHSAVDPLSFLNVFYWIGIVFTGIAMVMGFAGLWFATWKMALFNILATVPAFCIMGLSSALAHGVAVGVPKLIDFVGNGIGIDGVQGQKFLTLTWATVILLFVNAMLWCVVMWVARKEHKRAEIYEKNAIPMNAVHR